jgi:hypothetical protein
MFDVDDLLSTLPVLARDRPVFHSEADFQQALAWAVHTANPQLRVRLETRPQPRVRLDLLITDPADGHALAVELKYLTDNWEGEALGEQFGLLRQSAQDIRAYDCVKDIARVERLVANRYAQAGLVLVLTNDPAYWRAPDHGLITNADAFRLHDGLTLAGSRAWGPRTGTGTMGNSRAEPIELTGTYALSWQDYSTLPGPRGRFRYLTAVIHAG